MRDSSLILTVSLIGSLSWPLPALAQMQPCASAGPPQKPEPPPLFQKHRRGIYKNNQQIDVIDRPPRPLPLEIDAPGVPGKGDVDINLLTSTDMSNEARHIDVLRIDPNY